ncbi:MAG: hypothetical protein K5765_05930, partial [Clostridia bacterium]|nr:hypothetical protein [Clostridia bacterium]
VSASTNVNYTLISSNEYYDILIVGNNGKYYLAHIGKIFIDTEPPRFINSMTFFTAVSSCDDEVTDVSYAYSNLQTIWGNTVTNNIYTNAEVNVYAYVEDSASGVKTVKTGIEENATVLTKVSITGVPVLVVRATNELYAYYYGQSYNTTTYKQENRDLTYYRLKSSSATAINLAAYDNSDNYIDKNSSSAYKFTPVTLNLDNTEVTFSNNNGGTDWTNTSKVISFTVTTGISQLSKFDLIEKTVKNETINRSFVLPKYSSNGAIVPTSGDTTYINNYLSISVAKAGNNYTYSFNITYSSDIDSTFEIIGYNGITEAYAKGYKDSIPYKNTKEGHGECTLTTVIPHSHSSYQVRIDKTAPVIDDDATSTNKKVNGEQYSNIPSLTSWHTIARVLKVALYDSNNGNDVVSGIDTERTILFKKSGNNYTNIGRLNKFLTITGSKDNNAGIYISMSGTTQVELDEYNTYRIQIYDLAGNEKVYEFINRIDNDSVTITNNKVYFETQSGEKIAEAQYEYKDNAYVYYMTPVGVRSPIAWANTKLFLNFDYSCNSGLYVQVYSSDSNIQGTYTYSETEQKVIKNSAVVDTTALTGNYKISLGSGSSYKGYYAFRFLSVAEYNELSSTQRVTSGTTYNINLKAWETTSQESSKSIEVNDAFKTGLVAYDIITPTLSNSTNMAFNPAYGSSTVIDNTYNGHYASDVNAIYNSDNVAGYIDTQSGWLGSDTTFSLVLNSSSKFASGAIMQYQFKNYGDEWSNLNMFYEGYIYSYTNESWVKGSSQTNDCAVTINTTTGVATMAISLRESCNNRVYRVRMVTGSGLTTNWYTFGYIDYAHNVFNGIRIDKSIATHSSLSRLTNAQLTGEMTNQQNYQTQRQSEYQAAGNNVYDTNSGKYTKYNSIVASIAISNIGYSGATTTVKDNGSTIAVFNIPYAQGQQSVSRYFAVSGDGSHIVTIETVSGAGLHPTNITLTILIDTATPYLYVKGISGTKATNWGWTDNNIGIVEAEYYYISNVTITFGVGNIAYTGGTRYINSPNSSGYQIQYSNDNGDTWNKIGSANTSVFTVRDEGNYIFRIYANPESVTLDSNTGKFKAGTNIPLCYELGEDIKNNKDEIINKASIDFSALTDSPINGHVDGDNDDNSYTYIFFIDSSEYSYTYSGRVNLGNYGYDDYTENFVSIDTQMSNSSHIYSDANTVTKFHHGDKIKITYTSKYNATNNGGDFDYLHLRTTVGMPGDSDPTIVCNSENNAALEKNGYFYLQFINNNVEIISYFYAEVAVSYSSQKVFYIQDNELDLLAPTASGQYRNQSTNELIYLSFDYKYYKYNSEFNNATLVDSPSETGAYYVFTSVKSNCGDIRITKEGSTKAATNKQEFVLQYFNLTKTENSKNYYNVNNIDDFTHISDSYYVMDGSVINRTEKSYLYAENVYTLKENTNLDARQLSGDFAGEFDGNNNTITFYETELTESYGLFEKISGTVHSFNLVANSIININLADKSNIGLLAEELSGTIYDISVIADLNIMKVVAGSNIGGVVAKADSGATFGDNLKYVYSDVRITNINEREVYKDATPATGEKVNISSLVGFINSASINYVLVFGYIEMHNINTANISVGLGYGDAYENSSFVVSTFEYYGNNTYINDEYINGVTSSTTSVTYDSQPDPISYNTFVSSYENEIIGNVKIVEKHIRRLYQDFGYVYSNENLATYGNGTSANKLVIESVAQLSIISNYVNISYTINGNYNADKGVYEFDMTSFNKPIALHTIFNGSITTTDDKYVIMRGIGNYITNYEYDKFGLFAKFNGSISNIAFTDFVININQQTDRLYSGLVAAISYNNAVINNIIIIGRETVTSDIDDVATYVGSVVGFANESSINDIFTMNYISVNSDNVYVGGIVGNAESITLPKDSSEGAIYSLGTMVVNGNKNSFLGTIAGIGSIITATGIAESVYIIKDNTYKVDRAIEETIGNDNVNDYGVNIVTFDSLDMRNTSFKSINVNIFKNVVFGGIQLYPLIGEGTSANPFEINNESEFNNINIALYAEYKIKNNITFANFETIGNGLSFTGKISGSGGSEDEEPSAENSMITSLSNVTKPLVYQNKGEITDLSVNVRYTKTVKNVANFEYAPIAIINYGVIRNVKVEGNVNITAETNQTTIYTSGFVVYAKPQSSIIYDGDAEKMQNLISNLNITINGGGTVVFGGYAAELQAGDLFVFSYGLATGTVNINTPNNIHAGLLIGYAHQNYTFNLADNNPNYAYRIIENGVEKVVLDGEGKLIESTLIGKVWGE